MIEAGSIPDNWEKKQVDEETFMLRSEDRRKKIKMTRISVGNYDEPLPRLQAFVTQNPYQPGYGDREHDIIVEPSNSLEEAVTDIISDIE